MNTSYIKYSYEITTPDGMVKQLNTIKEWCRDIQVISSTFAVDQLKGPILILILKLDFKSSVSMDQYDQFKNKTPLNLSKQ